MSEKHTFSWYAYVFLVALLSGFDFFLYSILSVGSKCQKRSKMFFPVHPPQHPLVSFKKLNTPSYLFSCCVPWFVHVPCERVPPILKFVWLIGDVPSQLGCAHQSNGQSFTAPRHNVVGLLLRVRSERLSGPCSVILCYECPILTIHAQFVKFRISVHGLFDRQNLPYSRWVMTRFWLAYRATNFLTRCISQ